MNGSEDWDSDPMTLRDRVGCWLFALAVGLAVYALWWVAWTVAH